MSLPASLADQVADCLYPLGPEYLGVLARNHALLPVELRAQFAADDL